MCSYGMAKSPGWRSPGLPKFALGTGKPACHHAPSPAVPGDRQGRCWDSLRRGLCAPAGGISPLPQGWAWRLPQAHTPTGRQEGRFHPHPALCHRQAVWAWKREGRGTGRRPGIAVPVPGCLGLCRSLGLWGSVRSLFPAAPGPAPPAVTLDPASCPSLTKAGGDPQA